MTGAIRLGAFMALAGLSLGRATAAEAEGQNPPDLAFPAIRANLAAHQSRRLGQEGRRLQGSSSCLQNGDAAQCPLSDLLGDEDTLVFPGGDTRCLFAQSFGGDYAFQVIPGDSDKVVLNFDGGGVCFNQLTSGNLNDPTAITCNPNIDPEDPSVGIFSSEDERNPFRTYTKILVLYCSGDIHTGDITQPYTFLGEPVVQKGAVNTQAVLDWIAEQQSNGGLAAELESLVLVGESAGAIALLYWSAHIRDTIPAKAYKVLADSFVGVVPSEAEGSFISRFDPPCATFFEAGETRQKCQAGTLTVVDLYTDQLSRLGDEIPYLALSAKLDRFQLEFFNLAVATEPPGTAGTFINEVVLYAQANALFRQLVGFNFAPFWVDNGDFDFHTTTDETIFNTTSIFGPDILDTGNDDMFFRWVAQLFTGGTSCTKCSGDLVEDLFAQPDTDYCDAALVGQCAVTAASVCAKGILSQCGNVCCDASCGSCGGCDCHLFHGGAENCCPSTILFNNMPCLTSTDVACVVDADVICAPSGSGCDLIRD